MVKLDETRDYYADLELSPSCSVDDIKKQFRKLALIYHPDRNPGKEIENQPRFQAIQAAHEVLSDPQQRNKYDAARKRGSVSDSYSRPPATSRTSNPYKATTEFPPPPRRTGPRPANEGAQRYTSGNFPAPPPTPRRAPPSAAQTAQERTNNFRAWENMHHQEAQARSDRSERYDRRPKSGDVPTPPNPNFATPSPDAQWAGRPAAGRTVPPTASRPAPPPRRSGFDPSDPSGDEAPAPANYDRAHRPHMQDFGVPPRSTPKGTAPTARRPEQYNYPTVETPYVETERIRTPYVAHPEERTYFSTESLRRTASTRNATKPYESESEHSHGPNLRPNRARSSSPARKKNSSSPPPRKRSRDQDGKHQGRNTTGAPPHIVFSSSDSSATSSDAESKVKERRRAQPSAARMSRSEAANSTQGGPMPGGPTSGGPIPGKTRNSEHAHMGTSDTNNSNGDPRQARSPMYEYSYFIDESISPMMSALRRVGKDGEVLNFHPGPSQLMPFAAIRHHVKGHKRLKQSFTTTGFSFSVQPGSGRDSSPLVSPNSTHINTNFHPANEPIPFASTPPIPAESQGRASHPAEGPPRGRNTDRYNPAFATNEMHSPDVAAPPPPPPGPPPSSAQPYATGARPTPPPAAGTFSPDQWTAENWSSKLPPVSAPSPGISPTRQTPNSRRTRGGGGFRAGSSVTPQNSATPQATSVEDDAETMEPRKHGSPDDTMYKGGEPMDIDQTSTPPHLANGDRRPSGFGKIPPPPSGPPPSNVRSPVIPGPPPAAARQPGNLNMSDLLNTPPFQTGAGLDDLTDMANNLPFESGPSKIRPVRSLSQLSIPNPPKPPFLPAPADVPRLTKDSLVNVLGNMTMYINSWNTFDMRMTELMKSRVVERMELQRQCEGALVLNWLTEEGDSGWAAAERMARDDLKLRAHYNYWCEKHAGKLEEFGRLRKGLLAVSRG